MSRFWLLSTEIIFYYNLSITLKRSNAIFFIFNIVNFKLKVLYLNTKNIQSDRNTIIIIIIIYFSREEKKKDDNISIDNNNPGFITLGLL